MKKEFETILFEYKEYIADVFVTYRMPPFIEDAFRVLNEIDIDLKHLLELQKYTAIPLNIVFNDNTVIPSQKNLQLFLKNLSILYESGIRYITIPFLSWIEAIKKVFPCLMIRSSVLFPVKSVSDFIELAATGIDGVCLHSNLIRSIDLLKEIEATRNKDFPNVKLSIIANEGCFGSCLLKQEHRTLTIKGESDHLRKGKYYCHIANGEIISLLKKASIIPLLTEYTKYERIIDYFKLTGRNSELIFGDSLKILDSYSKGKDILLNGINTYGENIPYIFTLLHKNQVTINRWLKRIENCGFNCYKCKYCEQLFSKSELIKLEDFLCKGNF